MFFFFADRKENDKLIIDNKDDLTHLKVLRLNSDERLRIVFDDAIYLCEVSELSKKRAEFKILDKEDIFETKIKVNLYQGYPKKKKFEYIIEKVVEIGIDSITPFQSKNSVSKYESKKKERFKKIAKEACIQSHNPNMPEIKDIIDISDIKPAEGLNLILWHEADNNLRQVIKENRNINSVNFIVGSEGGLAIEEIQELKEKGFIPVKLPANVLRTETAALVFLSILRYEMQ
ncbi:MAG: hypothetical protein C0601_12340 [Candidatus Muiribacterium halophilum]|uniref:Ribosomal RNA small subunit methyltransferase E n=1 Tax=Muiribacterium halophilum TaxID=2053465 RepID=A0A2N5ZAR7_MUIH1|nr:MAG: hypothetical protein C0601_12340 [Candidatus Muirbacterium halophilum]